MIIFGNMLTGWYWRISLTWDMRLCPSHHILLISRSSIIFFKYWDTFLRPKNFSNGEIETRFKDLLASKALEFYLKGINKLFNLWQKYIDIQGSYFDWLKQFQFIDSGVKVNSKIGYYFWTNKWSLGLVGKKNKTKKQKQKQKQTIFS